MIEVVPYSRSHLKDFAPRAEDARNATMLRLEQGWDGNAVSAREDGRTLGICGFALRRGRAEAWVLLSDDMERRVVTISRWAKRSLPYVLELPGVEAIEAEVSTPQARRWAEWLGFEEHDGMMVWRQQRQA